MVIALIVVWGLMFAATMPIRQTYINGMIPSQQRATILSFDSMMCSTGGVWTQPVLGRAADVWGYAPSYLVGAGIERVRAALPVVLPAPGPPGGHRRGGHRRRARPRLAGTASLPRVPSKARSVASAGCLVLALLVRLEHGMRRGDPPKPASISLVSPADGVVVHEDAVEVRGRVKPAGARVLVDGRSAPVADGEFRTQAPLREGANVIDVGASAPGRAHGLVGPARRARDLVELPELAGATRDDAVDRLESPGLRAEVKEDGGLLDKAAARRLARLRDANPQPVRSCAAARPSAWRVSKSC